MSTPKHPVGAERTLFHEGRPRVARVTATHPDTGDVTGLAVYADDGSIECGVVDPKEATTNEHFATNGYFYKR